MVYLKIISFSCAYSGRLTERYPAGRTVHRPRTSRMGRSDAKLREGTTKACWSRHIPGTGVQLFGTTERLEVYHLSCGRVSRIYCFSMGGGAMYFRAAARKMRHEVVWLGRVSVIDGGDELTRMLNQNVFWDWRR